MYPPDLTDRLDFFSCSHSNPTELNAEASSVEQRDEVMIIVNQTCLVYDIEFPPWSDSSGAF